MRAPRLQVGPPPRGDRSRVSDWRQKEFQRLIEAPFTESGVEMKVRPELNWARLLNFTLTYFAQPVELGNLLLPLVWSNPTF